MVTPRQMLQASFAFIKMKNAKEVHYFLSDAQGEIITSGIQNVNDNQTTITIENNKVKNLSIGPKTLKIFASSDDVLKPYEFSTSFLVVESDSTLPHSVISDNFEDAKNDDYTILVVILVLIIIGLGAFAVRKKLK